MAQINNSDLTNALVQGAKISSARDKIPDQLGQTVVPILDVTPRKHRVLDICQTATRTTSGSTNLFTSSTSYDTFLVSCSLAMIKDATCDDASGAAATITAVVNAVTVSLLNIPGITLTACNESISISFPFPLKIDRGTSVSIGGGGYTVGTKIRTATVQGYTVNPY